MKLERHHPTNEYRTTDLTLAAFLLALGHGLVQVRSDGGRGVFVFEDSLELQDATLAWGNNEAVQIRLRSYVNNVRDLKGLIPRGR